MHRSLLIFLPLLALAAWLAFLTLTPTAAPPVVIAPPAEHPEAPGAMLRINAEAVDVFRRAFWRDPSPQDHILHAERREWVSDDDGVRLWQWYLAVKPSPEFLEWLTGKNSFGLSKSDESPDAALVEQAPVWFPRTIASGATVHRNPEGGFWLIHDPNRNLLIATDQGSGFAPRLSSTDR